MRLRHAILASGVAGLILLVAPGAADPEMPRVASKGELGQTAAPIPLSRVEHEPHERRTHDPWIPRPTTPPPGVIARSGPVVRGRFESIQVNVDEFGNNIPGDAANEPSIAIDPNDPNKIVIGWRQFDNVNSGFRQAGYAYSQDGGGTWTFPGSLTPGEFRSDPVLDADSDGNIFFYSLAFDKSDIVCDLFKSIDGGVTWSDPIRTFGGDKPWMVIDRTGGPGNGHIYLTWSGAGFARSTDYGLTFEDGGGIPSESWGTLAVAPGGELYYVGREYTAVSAGTVSDASSTVGWSSFEILGSDLLSGQSRMSAVLNGSGLIGQAWIATDHQQGSCRGHLYVLGSVCQRPDPSSDCDPPIYVRFARSLNAGMTWYDWIRIDDDPAGSPGHQWFGTMSVAPNGRIDVIWNDTRNDPTTTYSELYYAWSYDAGATWSVNTPASPPFAHEAGYPSGSRKLGDYYHMISDNAAANLAYAATFNGEQDVYFVRLTPDCDGNGIADVEDIASGANTDENENLIPDRCETDFDNDGDPDACDPDADNDGIDNLHDRCAYSRADYALTTDGTLLIDTNVDCVVDLVDFGRLRNCLVSGGPGIDPGRCADFFDADLDGDTDLLDLASFFRGFDGPASQN